MNLKDLIISKVNSSFLVKGSPPELKICCPYCGETRYRFGINTNKKIAHCFNCGIKMNQSQLIRFLGIVDSKTYSTTDLTDIETVLETPKVEIQEHPIYLKPDAIFAKDFDPKIHRIYQDTYREACEFLRNRRFDPSYLFSKYKLMIGNPNGRERNRIVLPIFENQELVYHQSRTINGSQPKYLNPSKMNGGGKAEFVFNYDSIAANDDLVLCEGIFSAISAGEKAIAILGKELSSGQRNKIFKKQPKSITILLDAGELRSSIKIAESLLGICEIRIANLLTGDPNEVSPDELFGAIRQASVYDELSDCL